MAQSAPGPSPTPPAAGAISGLRAVASRPCPACGAVAWGHTSVCPACGESLKRRPKKVRCARCGGLASSELVLCPHCGRELHPAPPRLLTWGAPVILAGLLALMVASRWESGNPFAWARERLAAGLTVIGQRIEPEVVIVVTPAPASGAAPLLNTGPVAITLGGNPTPTIATDLLASGPPALPPGVGVEEESSLLAGAAPLPLAASADATPAQAAALPTATPTNTPELAPTAMPSATPTVVESAVAVTTPAAIEDQGAVAQVTPQPTAVVYTVQAGDTLVTIAARHNVEVDELMEANNISQSEVFRIQPGQILIIPATPTPETPPTPTLPPTSTATPAASPTAPEASAAATPTPEATASATEAYRLAAPLLRSPADGASLSCDAPATLIWQRAPGIQENDRYVLHLGFVSGRSAGGEEQITWILAQPRTSTQTAWAVATSLCGLAPQSYGRQWRWWVEVVGTPDGADSGEAENERIPVSPPSEVWGFTWN
ncbi:MAG TPA: LysM peptidoglycan-binding domain-containing protein [Caldilineaceae bacterium]|nr:LysM peptidoglycan-binding domain-containing protein [Caldilineaceae bacterium]